MLVQGPPDDLSLLGGLAEGLGVRLSGRENRSSLWRALTEAVRLCRLQNLGVVLAVDDAHEIDDPAAIDRLTHLDPHPKRRSPLKVGRDDRFGPALGPLGAGDPPGASDPFRGGGIPGP